MTISKLRMQIAYEAARLMYEREESEYFRAKLKAARRVCRGDVKPSDLPTNREVRDQVQTLARLFEGEARGRNLWDMRLEALRMMRLLKHFRPRLIGSVLTGHVRAGSDIDLHVFCNSVEAVAAALDAEGMRYDVERKKVRKAGVEQTYRHIHVDDVFPFELTVYDENLAHYVFKSSITGKAIERASITELEALIAERRPDLDVEAELATTADTPGRFFIYESLLMPLERVKGSPKHHPEGDALYHSLQVFQLVYQERPYDEELLLAALLHDVGKAIDPKDHVAAGLEALADSITRRTTWLIAHHMEAHELADRTLGVRARKRLEAHEDFEDLMLLQKCDRLGRRKGIRTPDVQDALRLVRELSEMCEG